MTVTPATPPPGRVRRALLRTAFLLTGAALCVAFLLLQTGVVQVLSESAAVPLGVSVPLVALPVFVLGLLPGVREVEVAAARSLLGVSAELVTPVRLRPEHRRRSAGWVALHVLLGGAVGAALVIGVPYLVSVGADVLAGRPPEVGGLLGGRPLPHGLAGLALTLVVLALVGVVVVGAGWLMARWAPWFLGPTWQDRLLLAEDRLAREAEHQRLARELHDGIGHALSLISLQAVAGRRVIAEDAVRAAGSLQVIEQTARSALDDLDAMLGALREGPTARRPNPGVGDLDRLVATHRTLGLDVRTDIDPALGRAELPALVSSTVHQVSAEALTNAARYAAAAPVRLRVGLAGSGSDARVEVRVESRSDAGARPRRTGGRGLRGTAERVALLGGTLSAGPDGSGSWVLAVTLPLGGRP